MKLVKKGAIYHAQIRTAAGKSKTITTRCTDAAQARKVAKDSGIEQLEHAAKAGRLTQEVIGQIVTGKKLTVEKCIEPFKQDMAARGRSPKTIGNNLSNVLAWIRDAGIEKLPPSALTATHINDWINDPESKSKRSSRTVALASVRTFFEFLRGEGWIVADPSRKARVDMSLLSHEQKETEIKAPFSDAEVAAILRHLAHQITDAEKEIVRVAEDDTYTKAGREKKLAALHDEIAQYTFWRFAVKLSRETGLRLSDVCNLEWGCFSAGKVAVWMEKTDQRIEHEISEDLQDMVTQIPVTHDKYLFPEQHATITSVKRRALLSVQFKRLCERLDIAGKSFHCLRHAKATTEFHHANKDQLAAALADALTVGQIQQLLGHASAKTSKGYIH